LRRLPTPGSRLPTPGNGHTTYMEAERTPPDTNPARRVPVPDDVEEEARVEAEDAARRNPDPETRRETLELDLMDEDRSELGEEIGDEMP